MKKFKAFSSVEMAISLVMIIVVISVLVFYFNPMKMISERRNNQRTQDVTSVLDALTKYAGDNAGTLPEGIPVSNECARSEYEMCKSGSSDCEGKIVLTNFSSNTKYLDSLPTDPKSNSANGTGYNIVQNDSGRVTVCAPMAELGKNISLSK